MVNQTIALLFGIGVTVGAVISIPFIIRKQGITQYSIGLLLLTGFWLFWGLRALHNILIEYSETMILILTYGAVIFLLAGLGLLLIAVLTGQRTSAGT